MSLTIKRYSNRKLYNIETRRYITLAELGELVRRGVEVQVIEHDNGADVTGRVLAQVISGEQKRPETLLTGALSGSVLAHVLQRGEALLGARKSLAERHDLAEAEIRRRVQRLVMEGALDENEAPRWLELLLAPCFREDDEPVSQAQVQQLKAKLEWLENEISQLGR